MRCRLLAWLACVVSLPISATAQPRDQWTEMKSRRVQAREAEHAARGGAGAALQSSAVISPFTVTALRFAREVDGTISAVGEVQNATSVTVTFGQVFIDFYANGAFIGGDDTFIFAPQAVRLAASGIFTEALPAGATGFFKMYTSVNYNSVTHYVIDTEAETFGFVPVRGQTTVQSASLAPNVLGGTNVTGTVRNASAQALTYFTQIALAGYTSTGIADVTFTFASGISVPCGAVTSTSGVPPGATVPFSDFFLHPVTSIGRAFVVWDEVAINPGSSTVPASGGAGSIQVAGNCAWSAASNVPWLAITSGLAGSGDGVITYSVAANTAAAVRTGTITVKGIPFTVTQAAGSGSSGIAAPFGTVDTPLQNASGVTGSIAVTGWALDDAGVTAIRILRDPVGAEAPGQRVFVGNAVLVQGARPDVAAAYAAYPNNTRAGWGYLMLTNMLPNQGNGVFTFYMYADDANGNATLLGSRTITCTNASATTPFGAIDTPGQGQTVSGSVNNFGWVLSPGLRRADPPGGGIVNVVIDGALAGAPSGWTSRPDISALFPVSQYSGVNFALGVRTFSSLPLSNGVHTIAWVVTDNQGGAAGVGSRYFTVANGALKSASRTAASLPSFSARVASDAIKGRRGFDFDAPFRRFTPDSSGVITIDAEELDRIELQLGATAGHLQTALGTADLPIGSRIDSAGTFTWHPGVGFVGTYELWFDTYGGQRRVRVHLHPKQSNRVGPQVVIDTPSSMRGVDGAFVVAGWAIDLDAGEGTGVDVVHVWAYPRDGSRPHFLGAAALEGKRPDVAAIYGERFADAGFGLRVDSLPPGSYEIAVFARSTVRVAFLPARTVSVSIRK